MAARGRPSDEIRRDSGPRPHICGPRASGRPSWELSALWEPLPGLVGQAPGLVTPHPSVALLKIPPSLWHRLPRAPPTPCPAPLVCRALCCCDSQSQACSDFLPWEGDRRAGVAGKTPPGPDFVTGDEGRQGQEGRGRPWYLPVAHKCLVAQPRVQAWPHGD